ncbi:MAG: DUF2273 domain-containing protein [Clostridiales bacterium]|nr:DUF2273 domain-containing protein [Clostridiales bacterium]
MIKERLLEILKSNKGIVIGGLIGLLIFIFGLTKLVTLVFLVALGMIVGNTVDKNKEGIKESIKNFVDKF